ncbi:sugar transferase [Aurantimicrobium minutum]|uniref:sugar transferase n=1 Tax=Aurantimicrobium minutum TaxID=708131 RepID=UPI0024762A01|nr:sugar transferase [Aurantimicrobium minutum]MDH6208374.1 lipopolysaccharide/colanic/teichoic acid biosynthesis glycosyltransferase [Aurantimicrobium minutum]
MIQRKRIYPFVKRALDILGAILLLIIASPVMLITAFLVRINLGSPVIFSQPRPGLNERIFKLYKFRSMKNVDIEKGLLTDEQRLTRFGKILRSTSLDELPSLWNVLKGEMSFVGPRPLLVEYLPLYSEKQRGRHRVRPGLTGLAQVSGRNFLEWEKKFNYDIDYIENEGFKLDFFILFKSVFVVLQREHISAPGQPTMQQFTGNKS